MSNAARDLTDAAQVRQRCGPVPSAGDSLRRIIDNCLFLGGNDAADIWLSCARDSDSKIAVAGPYRHSRVGEAVIGGGAFAGAEACQPSNGFRDRLSRRVVGRPSAL